VCAATEAGVSGAVAAAATAGVGWPQLLTTLIEGRSLDSSSAAWAMREVMAGDASPAQVAAFVVALRAKGETAEEVAALAAVMIEFAARVELGGLRAVDTCGTGGGVPSFNLSTASAFVACGAGVRIAKHGNR